MSYGDHQTRRQPSAYPDHDPYRETDRRLQALEYQNQTGIDRSLIHGQAIHKLREDFHRLEQRHREGMELIRAEAAATHNKILLALVTVLGGAMFSAFSGLVFKSP